MGNFVLLLMMISLTPRLVRGQEPQRDDTHVESVVRSAVADEFSSEILTNKTRAYLSCESGEMIVKINFTKPFRGVTYTDYDRTSPCKFFGDGSTYYELRIPLKGCGTRQEAPRVFINNIIVRFHRSLELEEDEIKTIICRYPPPVAPLPGAVVPPPLEPAPIVPAAVTPKLSEIELLLIICAILFLTLLLLGIGIAYYCLKKRNIKVVRRKKAMSSAPGSVITRLSGATSMPVIEPMTIPRVPGLSPSGSEAALLPSVSSHHGSGEASETIPSDYPSESPSPPNSVEDGDVQRSVLISDSSTYRKEGYDMQNMAFIPDDVSERSGYPEDTERAQSVSSVPIPTAIKSESRIVARREPKPRIAKQQLLTTINEREDYLHTDMRSEEFARMTMTREELEPPAPKYVTDAPVYTKTRHKPPSMSSYAPSLYGSIPDNDNRSHTEMIETVSVRRPPSVSSYAPSLYGSIPDNDNRSHSEIETEAPVKPYVRKPKTQVATISDYYLDTQRVTDIQEDTTRTRQSVIPGLEPDTETRSVSEIIEPSEVKALVPAPHTPKITVQNIDDVYLTTLTETHATEHVTRHKKDVMEQHTKPPSTWDVTIRHYPPHSPGEPGPYKPLDTFSEISENPKDTEKILTEPPVHIHSKPPSEITEGNRKPPNWDIIFRVLHPPPTEDVHELTEEDKEKWKAVVSSDTTFCSLIQEATTTEEFVKISRDERYEKMYTPRKWQVIIRILTAPEYLNPPVHPEPPPDVRPPRYRKRSDHEPRSRKSSVPPVQGFIGDPSRPGRYSPESVRSRRTSRSVSVKDLDVRSMTEMDVDFAHADRESLWSVDTGYTYRTSRSIGERSTSEFLEDVPTVPSRQTSREHPILERSTSEFIHSPEFIQRENNFYSSDVINSYRQPSLTGEQGNHVGLSSRPGIDNYGAEIIINSPIMRALNSVGTNEEQEFISHAEMSSYTKRTVT
ncbi:uncharacterized protein LOC143245276 [Tachypleus tridentatus]|uniref:uncharacterized protein LOC143245276 n=1 Tax=Tachypleus tridentatus TaxID=6853 RepID=UPI003FD24136